ncbi:MAG: serine/threonine-protein kinase PknK [Dehalococcoidia bacterium]
MDNPLAGDYYSFIMASDRLQRQVERLLDEADQAITKEDWSTVASRARAVLRIDPGNSDALSYLAVAERDSESPGAPLTSPSPLPEVAQSTPPSDQPASFANSRYEVKRFLGEGGKKKVYLAHDSLLDRDVAFALIKTEGLDEVSRTRITREAQAMGRLGSHPHIVTVFDLGEHEGQPYMVTELMGGGDVEGVVGDAPDHRLSLEQAISIAVETCRGLEFAHSRGIVHRDLKPGNVWLTGDGVAKIGDFGLAVAIDRSRLTSEGMMVGTVSYMPPEQAMGGEVPPRSDLYSLGAILYEMVTGRPPFLGDDSVAIIGQHVNTPPVAPTWHCPGCSRPLEALILRLLAKNPDERPESATDVLAALEAVDLTVSAEPPQPADEAHALDSLAGGVFVGRQQEMGELKACLEDALSGRGRLVTLVGEPGIGKTRTAQELTTYAGLRGAQVLWGRCYEEQGMPPYWPWVQAIRSYVRERDPEQLRAELGAGAADIAEVVSDVKERLPDLQPAPQLEPDQARFRLFDSIAAFLKTASQRQPLVLVLDDLHWADQPSLLLLQFMARELGGARLLLIGTYRDVELSRQHPLAETLGELTRERLFQRVLLRGLSLEDVGRFIEIATGVEPPQGLSQAVYTQTEGNPLFVTEVVRLLVQEGKLTPEGAGDRDSWTVQIPEGVREVIGRRLNRLSQRCNETLTIASVIGREFTLDQLKPLIDDLTEDRLLEVLEEALATRVIEELPQSVGRYQFTHALIQETLTDELTLTRRVRLHARIAETLELLYAGNVEAHAAELAHHFAEAVTVTGPNRLVQYCLLAGERALAGYAHQDALAHFQRAFDAKENQPMDAEMASILFGLGRSQATALPRYQIGEAVASLNRAFDYYAEVGDVLRAVAVAEYPLPTFAGQRIGVAELLAKGLELVQPNSPEAGRLLSEYARVLAIEEGNYEDAQSAFDQALGIAQREQDATLEMRTLTHAVYVDSWYLRWQEALSRTSQAIELSEQAGDLRAEAQVRAYAGLIRTVVADSEEAHYHAGAALAVAERLRDRTWLVFALWSNETLCRLQGDWQAARELSDRGLAVAPREPRLLGFRALLEYEVGDFAAGEIYLERLLEAMRLSSPGPTVEYQFPAIAIPLVTRITGVAERLEIAQSAAEAVLSSGSVLPLGAQVARAGLALLAVERKDAEVATQQYSMLQTARGIMVFTGIINGDRLLGLLSQIMGDLDRAAAHFEDALTFCRKAGYRPELAWTCCDYADTLLERNSPGDQQKAMSLLDESLAISTELGLRPLMERALSRRDILKA